MLHDFTDAPQEARFRLEAEGGEQRTSLPSDEELRADEAGGHRVALPAYGYR